jgi:hypothetical protein
MAARKDRGQPVESNGAKAGSPDAGPPDVLERRRVASILVADRSRTKSPDNIQKLVESIRVHGLLQAILITIDG